MAGLSDLFGPNGVLEQLLLWGVVNQVVSTLGSPAFTALQQDILAKNPDLVLTPEVLAAAASRFLVSEAAARAEAGKGGIDSGRFGTLLEIAKIRIAPADLAEAVLRSYVSKGDAEAQAHPQGVTPAMLQVYTDLAGDAPGPDQLAAALRRGIIGAHGRGRDSVSFDQGIAETRLHNKWGHVVEALSAVLLTPQQAAEAAVRGRLPDGEAARIAAASGVGRAEYDVLRFLAQPRLSPPDAASAVIRNFLDDARASAIAAEQGIDEATFDILRHLAGDAPGPQQLAEALRRGAIDPAGTGPASTSFQQGIAEGRLADKWAPVIKALARVWPTPTDALDAALKGQITPEQGKDLYELLGGDLQFYPWLLSSQGEGPSPLEATVMANRGFIPWDGIGAEVTSFAQAVRESRFRDKWAAAYKGFARYLMAPGEVVTFLAHGAITSEAAADLLAQHGMDAPTVTAFLDEAHTEALSAYRGLTVSTVLTAYHAQILPADGAKTILTALHVTPDAIDLLLAYTDVQRDFEAVTNAVSRVRMLFASRKITVETVKRSLHDLGIPDEQIGGMVAAWEVENSISVKVLTGAEIVDAWTLGILTEAEAETELENLGYTPFDAWVYMSIKAKAPLPGRPAQGPAPPQAQVIPGTT